MVCCWLNIDVATAVYKLDSHNTSYRVWHIAPVLFRLVLNVLQSGQAFTCHDMDDPKSSVLPPTTSKVARNKYQENVAVQNFISSSVACVQENGAH